MWENTTPSTELPRDHCAGIGPLQLGVVLVGLLIVAWAILNILINTYSNVMFVCGGRMWGGIFFYSVLL